MGCLVEIVAIAALVLLWRANQEGLFWTLTGIVVLSFLCAQAVKNSTNIERACGDDSDAREQRKVTTFWLSVATVSYISEVIVAIYGIIKVI